MVSVFLSGLYLFLFVFAWYILLVVSFKFLKTIALKTGKVDLGKQASFIIGLAISYIITVLIIGF